MSSETPRPPTEKDKRERQQVLDVIRLGKSLPDTESLEDRRTQTLDNGNETQLLANESATQLFSDRNATMIAVEKQTDQPPLHDMYATEPLPPLGVQEGNPPATAQRKGSQENTNSLPLAVIQRRQNQKVFAEKQRELQTYNDKTYKLTAVDKLLKEFLGIVGQMREKGVDVSLGAEIPDIRGEQRAREYKPQKEATYPPALSSLTSAGLHADSTGELSYNGPSLNTAEVTAVLKGELPIEAVLNREARVKPQENSKNSFFKRAVKKITSPLLKK